MRSGMPTEGDEGAQTVRSRFDASRLTMARGSSASRRSSGAVPTVLDVDDLSVTLVRKRIKNINLHVKAPDGHVEVSAPFRVSDVVVADFVRQKRAWIEEKRSEIESSPRVEAAQASADDIAAWRTVIEATVPVLVERWEPVMGVKAGKLAYRNMTSRWGSCQPSTGRICINVRLALYPPQCLEYVVVHELCHLLERGHGPRFRALMDTFMPDWRYRRAQLR